MFRIKIKQLCAATTPIEEKTLLASDITKKMKKSLMLQNWQIFQETFQKTTEGKWSTSEEGIEQSLHLWRRQSPVRKHVKRIQPRTRPRLQKPTWFLYVSSVQFKSGGLEKKVQKWQMAKVQILWFLVQCRVTKLSLIKFHLDTKFQFQSN